jgi:hypothetical protein
LHSSLFEKGEKGLELTRIAEIHLGGVKEEQVEDEDEV